MPSPEQSPSPIEVADVPADWPTLWSEMLQVRDGGGLPQAGARSERSAALFEAYRPLLEAGALRRAAHGSAPWVVAQLGQSLDGFVATATGDSYYVNGAHGLLHLHRLRALCDAVVVGAGTVSIDNPQLTTRRVPGPSPVRVVMDPRAGLDGHSRVFRDGQAPSLWLCDARHAGAARERLRGAPATTEVLAVDNLLDEADNLACYHAGRAVAALGQRGLRVLFVEGGGMTVSRFFRSNALDRLHLVIAPVLIGSGRRGLQVAPRDVMAECPRPPAHTLRLGADMLWDLDLRAVPPGN